MLEVKNLTKIYKTKGGDVTALDNVSVTFPEKGMVFLLGKSGSGKSTLLNICGGLDSPTSGEIIVKGKSSKDFLQSDFDSYRNTFIGFVFQEYNILNEFSVEDNIALALELQGKPKNKDIINNLLEQVELEGYNNRKPNTLSGGQKQRIAIARAIVKSPEIIMADEPTGALDSNTGKQVFETLKKLSKDKLVLIVSHDRDFAEQYADRIIELKDGKIISDVLKTTEHQKSISTNVNKIGNTLCISNGENLTETDFNQIKTFLKNSKGNVVIASDEKEVKNFKNVNRITNDGSKEVFVNTNENDITKKSYTPEDSKFITSKLPIKHAFKLGVSGLKSKPIRLIFTIFLCVVAFSLFALSSTMMFYNKTSTLKNSLENYAGDTLMLEKKYQVTVTYHSNNESSDPFTENRETLFTQEDLTKIKSTLCQDAIIVTNINYTDVTNLYSTGYSYYYTTQLKNAVYLDENNSFRNKIQGSYPLAENEVVISSYLADSIIFFGLKDENGNKINLNNRLDLIGKKINFNFKNWVITGIFQTPELDTKFDSLKEGKNVNTLHTEFISILSSNLYTTAIVSQTTLDNLIKENNNPFFSDKYFNPDNSLTIDNSNRNAVTFESINAVKTLEKYYFKENKTQLNNNQILVSVSLLSNVLETEVDNYVNELKQSSKLNDANKLEEYYNTIQPKLNLLLSSVDTNDYDTYVNEVKSFINYFNELTNSNLSIRLCVDMPNGESVTKKEFTIEGFFVVPNNSFNYCYLSSEDFKTYKNALIEKRKEENGGTYSYQEESTNYIEPKDAKYSAILISFNHSSTQINNLVNLLTNLNQDDSLVVINNPITQGLNRVDNLINILSPIFLIVGIVLAVFSSLLLSNFISVSISNKKKDIGILRAVGARSIDVFKIFFSESLVVMLICIVLSIFVSTLVCYILNTEFTALLSGVAVFVFGPLNVLILTALALISTFLATFFPVNSAAKKKPVESIRAL